MSSKTVEKWLEKGDDLIKRKKYENALMAHDKAIAINPQYADAGYNRITKPSTFSRAGSSASKNGERIDELEQYHMR